jgi:hypothetical protein
VKCENAPATEYALIKKATITTIPVETEFHEIPSIHGIPWNSIEFHGIPWNFEFRGIPSTSAS